MLKYIRELEKERCIAIRQRIMMNNKINKEDLKNVKIVSGKDVDFNIIKEALDLEYEFYNDKYHITEKKERSYLERNPYIYFVALYNNKLVGYINFSPITIEMYEKIKTGTFIDTIIEKEDILTYEDNKEYINYFSSVVVDTEYQGYGIGNMLIESVKKFVLNIEKERGIKINKIIADVISKDGMTLVSKLGLKVIKESNHNSKIAEWKRN